MNTLTVIDAAILVAESNNLPATCDGLREARAAVAEMVEAATWARKQLAPSSPSYFPGHPEYVGFDKLVAALAKFGGAA